MSLDARQSKNKDTLADVTPLQPEHFYLLYQTGISGETVDAEYHNALLLLSIGRLGFERDTLLHLHEGWVEWPAGTIRIPAHDPCTCERCLSHVLRETDISDPQEAATATCQQHWQPANGPRAIDFSWSQRLIARIVEFFERFDYFDAGEPIEDRLQQLAADTEGLNPNHISARRLRASAAHALAEMGFDRELLARTLGIAEDTAEQFVQRAVVPNSAETLEYLERYRVLANPQPFAEESLDPRDYSQDILYKRHKTQVWTSDRYTNPRSKQTDISTREAAKSALEPFIDIHSDLVSVSGTAIESQLFADVERRDSRDEPDKLDLPPTLSIPAIEEADDVSTGTGAGPDDDEEETAVESDWGPEPVHIDEFATHPQFRGQMEFGSKRVTDGTVVKGEVVLDNGDMLLDISGESIQEDAKTYRIPVETVNNVSLDYSPPAFKDRAGRSIGIQVVLGGNKTTIAFNSQGNRKSFLVPFFKLLLNGEPVIITYPSRKGGHVVRDSAPKEARIYLAEGSIKFEHAPGVTRGDATKPVVNGGNGYPTPNHESDILASIPLKRITELSSAKQTFNAISYDSIKITHLDDTTEISSKVGVARSDKSTEMLRKFLGREHHKRMKRLEQISLSHKQKQALVMLHSQVDELALSNMLNVESDELFDLLDNLKTIGLVRDADDGSVELTDHGHVAVNQKVDDVNL